MSIVRHRLGRAGPAGISLSPPSGAPGGPSTGNREGARPAGLSRRQRRPQVIALLIALALAGAVAVAGDDIAAAVDPAAVAAKLDPRLADVTAVLGAGYARAEGTGIVLTSNGEVLTNNHVIAGAISITVTDVGNSRTYPADVVGYDRLHDIAVLQLRGASGLKAMPLGGSPDLMPGQRVMALGNAGGRGGTPAMAVGMIAGLDQTITTADPATDAFERLTGLIASNVSIAAGDSGGPLVNTTGQIVGIDTAASPGSRFPSVTPARAYSIPASQAASIARRIEAGRASAVVHIGATAFLGATIMLSEIPGLQYGDAQVTDVIPDSPAAAAGLTAHDVITSLGSHTITSASDVQNVISQYHPGDRIRVGWTDRTGRPRTASVTLVKGPAG